MKNLQDKISSLPMHPGVYLMKDKTGKIIYVGKAKHLKNRVSSYFVSNKGHSFKTNILVSHIDDFDIIITKSEFDALVLENSLIKKHKPKYNILLKDDKGYPYIKITYKERYPDFFIVSKPLSDGNKYLGPYISRHSAKTAIDTIKEALKIRTCSKVFPRDLYKERPCLNAHIGKCSVPCAGKIHQGEYYETIKQAEELLKGNFKDLLAELEAKMLEHSENLNFEQASVFRDKIIAINKLKDKQSVVSSGFAELDVISFSKGYTKSAITVFHILTGSIAEKETTILDGNFEPDEALSSFMKQYYSLRNLVPKDITLSHEISDLEAINEFLSSINKTKITVPQSGIRRNFVNLALINGNEEILRVETSYERTNKTLEHLSNILGSKTTINRIESYDISHISGTNTVGSMICFVDGKPKKSEYRKFKLSQDQNDDFASMKEIFERRIINYIEKDEKFSILPDLFLIDGGRTQLKAVCDILDKYNINVMAVSMVKDDRHRTRGLMFSDGREVSLETLPNVYTLVSDIQEEVHRFAITYHKALRNKAMKKSSLDNINGVGAERRKKLIAKFKSIENIKKASLEELQIVVPLNVAQNIVDYYKKD